MLKFIGRFGGAVLQLRNFGSLPSQNPNIDSAYASNVGPPKGNADWWPLLALYKIKQMKINCKSLEQGDSLLIGWVGSSLIASSTRSW